MTKERTTDLLTELISVVADEFQLDVAVELMLKAGFTFEEMHELGFDV